MIICKRQGNQDRDVTVNRNILNFMKGRVGSRRKIESLVEQKSEPRHEDGSKNQPRWEGTGNILDAANQSNKY